MAVITTSRLTGGRLVSKWRVLAAVGISCLLLGCQQHNDSHDHDHGHSSGQADHHAGHGDEHGAAEFEKGVHGGRLLKDGPFTLELAIYETGVPPEFRAWVFNEGKPVALNEVDVSIRLSRLGGKVDELKLLPEVEFLRSNASVYEPHSFQVVIQARYKGKTHTFSYDSIEGRTRIEAKLADGLGVKTEVAGPASLNHTLTAYGSIIADPALERAISARFDGVITSVHVNLGERVNRGQPLFTVETNEALRPIVVNAPISGQVVQHLARAGEQTQGRLLMRILDTSTTWAELAIFPQNLSQVHKGAAVSIAVGESAITGAVDYISPEANANQAVNVRAKLTGSPLPVGSQVSALIQVAHQAVPLAVKRSALQSFRDFTVVYAQVGDEYEVRMLTLGRSAGEWVEVLAGLEAGTRYVSANSFVIKADIEKSGASHDH